MYGDLNGDGNWFNDLAPGTTRNGRRGKKEGRFDARLAREFGLPNGLRLGASVDVFNVLNATHYRDVDTTLYSAAGGVLVTNPLFGTRSNAREPRVIQLGVSLAF